MDPLTGRSTFKVIIAGHEFGCGSSRETAPQALHYAGVEAVIARSFARIFFRNCINLGLIIPIQYDHPFDDTIVGQVVEIDVDAHTFTVAGRAHTFQGFGPLDCIIRAGGLIPYTQARLRRAASSGLTN